MEPREFIYNIQHFFLIGSAENSASGFWRSAHFTPRIDIIPIAGRHDAYIRQQGARARDIAAADGNFEFRFEVRAMAESTRVALFGDVDEVFYCGINSANLYSGSGLQ